MAANYCSSLELLHSKFCKGTEDNVMRMRAIVASNPSLCRQKPSNDYDHPLLNAVSKKHTKCVDFLVKAGFNVYGSSILFWSIETMGLVHSVSFNIIKTLLDNGIHPNSKDTLKTLNLESAVYVKDLNIVQLLLEHGAQTEDLDFIVRSTHAQNSGHFPPSICALNLDPITSYNFKCLLKLLFYGAIVNYHNIPNISNLLLPRIFESISLIHCIINAKKQNYINKKKVINMLYEFGANLWIPNSTGSNCHEMIEDDIRNKDYLISIGLAEFAPGILTKEEKMELASYVKELMVTPRSLKSLSRLAIREAVGPKNYPQAIPKLGFLPNDLYYNYLSYKDIELLFLD